MLQYSMVQLAKKHHEKFDRALRKKLVRQYRPFRRIPCFLHHPIENMLKKRKKFPVIIEYEQNEGVSLSTALRKTDQMIQSCKSSKIDHYFSSTNSCSAVLTASTIEKLIDEECHVKRIYFDRKVKALLDVATPSIHAEELNHQGLTGKDINIAIVDTGVYPHEDLTKPTNRMIAFKDFVNNRGEAYDDNGHGTHCAGDAAGNGYMSDGKYSGPASEAGVIGVKVLDQSGAGSLSTIVSGIQWCIDHKEEHQIDVISLSLGAEADESNCHDPLVQIVEKAWENGMVVCAAAGNSGPDKGTIGTPGNSSKIVTVGAMDDKNTVDRSDDEIASFSSRGPACGVEAKPDILAPGVNIVSLRSSRSQLDKTFKSNRVDKNYVSLSGTSMATPIVAGVAAIILQANPEYSPDEVKQQLLHAAVDWDLPLYVQGSGYLDAERTVKSHEQAH